MKVPKYIIKLLKTKANSYSKALSAGVEVDRWLDKHGIEIEEYDRADGCEAAANPYTSINTIIKTIEEYNDNER